MAQCRSAVIWEWQHKSYATDLDRTCQNDTTKQNKIKQKTPQTLGEWLLGAGKAFGQLEVIIEKMKANCGRQQCN